MENLYLNLQNAELNALSYHQFYSFLKVDCRDLHTSAIVEQSARDNRPFINIWHVNTLLTRLEYHSRTARSLIMKNVKMIPRLNCGMDDTMNNFVNLKELSIINCVQMAELSNIQWTLNSLKSLEIVDCTTRANFTNRVNFEKSFTCQ